MRDTLVSREATIKALKAENEALKAENRDLKAGEKATIKQQKATITQKGEDNKRLLEERNRFKEANETLKASLAEEQVLLESLRAELEIKRDTNAKLVKRLKERKGQVETLELAAQEMLRKVNALDQANLAMVREAFGRVDEIDERGNTITILQGMVKTLQSDLVTLRATAAGKTRKLEDTNKALLVRNATLEALSGENMTSQQTACKMIRDLQVENDQLQAQVKQLEADITRVDAQCKAKVGQITESVKTALHDLETGLLEDIPDEGTNPAC